MIFDQQDYAERLIDNFAEYLRLAGFAHSTAIIYSRDVVGFFDWRPSSKASSDQIEIEEIAAYQDYLASKFKPSTVNRKSAAVKTFARWFASISLSDGLPAGDPTSNRGPRSSDNWLSPEEQRKLSDIVMRVLPIEERIIFLLMLKLGVSIPEIRKLTWKDIDLSGQTKLLRIRNAHSQVLRTVCLPSVLAAPLSEMALKLRSKKSDEVFNRKGDRITRRAIQMMLARIGRSSGINVSTYSLKRTYQHNALSDVENQPSIVKDRTGLENRKSTNGQQRSTRGTHLSGSALAPSRAGRDSYQDFVLPDLALFQPRDLEDFASIRSNVPRNSAVRTAVRQRANGRCERCRIQLPQNLLEIHHIILTAQKEDRQDNCVALCPTCHRLVHLRVNLERIEAELLAYVRTIIKRRSSVRK